MKRELSTYSTLDETEVGKYRLSIHLRDNIYPAVDGLPDSFYKNYNPRIGIFVPDTTDESVMCELPETCALSINEVNVLVATGLSARINFTWDGNSHIGTLYSLIAAHGISRFPFKSRGLLTMLWISTYKGTEFEYAMDSKPRPPESAPPQRSLPILSLYLKGPALSSDQLVFYEGQYITAEVMECEGRRYCLCDTRLSSVVVDVPASLKAAMFFKYLMPIGGDLTSLETYRTGSDAYADQYVIPHRVQAEFILENVPSDVVVCEPGCGAGIVCDFRPNTISGDLYPPKLKHKKVIRETISATLGRAPDDALVYCGYIHCFMTADLLKKLARRMVIWLDAPGRNCFGIEVFPGLWCHNVPDSWLPHRFKVEQEKLPTELMYTENLLNSPGYRILQESIYTRYIRAMRPLCPLVPLGSYPGGFVGYSSTSFPVLCSTISELVHTRRFFPCLTLYFAETGTEVCDFFKLEDILVQSGMLRISIMKRAVYAIPSTALRLVEIFRCLPSITIDQTFYFYSRFDVERQVPFTVNSPDEEINGLLFIRDSIPRTPEISFILSSDRITVDYGGENANFLFRGFFRDVLNLLDANFPYSIPEHVLRELESKYRSQATKHRHKIQEEKFDKLRMMRGTGSWNGTVKQLLIGADDN